ncbi:MAG: hypothetical protein HFG28_14475 [Eubacterium sp.]|nr:hypothetical protein [Eubacterium sp.]
MNSAKKIVSGQEKETKGVPVSVPSKKQMGSGSGFGGGNKKPIVLGALCVLIVLILCIGVGVQQFRPKNVVTVDKEKISMSDMMYPIYEVESQYAPYNEMYMSAMGTSFWNSAYQGSGGTGEGVSEVTNAIGIKQEIISREVQYEILSKLASKNKFTLTEDEKKEAEKNAEKALKGLSWFQKFQLDFSKKRLTSLFEKRALADKYRESKQEELNKTVKREDAIKDLKKADYRQYDLQFYYASVSETDDEGKSKPVADDKKKSLKAKIEEIAKKAKNGDDFTKLSDDKDKDLTFEKDGNFVEKDGWEYLSDANLKKVKKMKNGQVSQAFLDESSGYYVVVKMINNNSEEAYKTACDDAEKTKQEEAFANWYTEEETKHKIDINTDIWTEVALGTVTTDIVTAEDLNDMNEDSSDAASGSNE